MTPVAEDEDEDEGRRAAGSGTGWWGSRVGVGLVAAVVPAGGTVLLVAIATGVRPSPVLVLVTYAAFAYLHARKRTPRAVVGFGLYVVGVLGFLAPFAVLIALARSAVGEPGVVGRIDPGMGMFVLLSAFVTGWGIAAASVYASRRVSAGTPQPGAGADGG